MALFQYSRAVKVWLFVGLVLLFIQIFVGGITRLTESGLSITKWDVVSGTLPPLSETAWQKEFDLYKQTPQYLEINTGMSISDFKFIFFWEFMHRFWARFMGFVFIIPFCYFLMKKKFDAYILKRLGGVILLAVLAATFGWIMVKSGLQSRPWVNAYKLSFHLCIALSVYVYLLWTWLNVMYNKAEVKFSNNSLKIFIGLIWVQLFIGGMMSGMKAAVYYPEWPLMQGQLLPDVLFDASQWNMNNFTFYDQNIFIPTLVQFLHRLIAYTLFGFGVYLCVQLYKINETKRASIYVFVALIIQVLLGILTLINSKGEVPISYGVLHQSFAVLLLTFAYYLYFVSSNKIIMGNKQEINSNNYL